MSPVSRVAASTRAATLTGSPITLNSRRPAPPTLPATTVPELSPIPNSSPCSEFVLAGDLDRGGQRLVGMIGLAPRGAEHGQQAVADELVDAAAVVVDDRHDLLEQLVDG